MYILYRTPPLKSMQNVHDGIYWVLYMFGIWILNSWLYSDGECHMYIEKWSNNFGV